MDNKKSFNNKNFIGIGLAALVLLVLGLVLAGYLAITWKQPAQQVLLVTRVCDNNLVERFNKIEANDYPKLVKDIKAKSGYESDPTCQTILLNAAFYQADYRAAKNAYEAVKSLNEQGLYANNSLNTGQSLSGYEASVQELSPSNQSNNAQEP